MNILVAVDAGCVEPFKTFAKSATVDDSPALERLAGLSGSDWLLFGELCR